MILIAGCRFLSEVVVYSSQTTEIVETTPTNTAGKGDYTIHPVGVNSSDYKTETELSTASLAGIAAGTAVPLLLCIALLVWMIVRRKKKSESSLNASSVNPAFSESSVPAHGQRNSDQQECPNVLYGTTEDLKLGSASGVNSREEVDNVLYGTTASPNSTKVAKASNQAVEMYTTVQKVKKKTGKRNKDPEASTSGLMSDDTYAEVDRGGKKKKKAKGRENPTFSGGLQEDAMYAAVDKKQKGKNGKGKKIVDEPGMSAAIEEATYAAINKKEKKPKKDGSDDEDLHGSNVA